MGLSVSFFRPFLFVTPTRATIVVLSASFDNIDSTPFLFKCEL